MFDRLQRGITQPRHGCDGHYPESFSMQSHDLLTPLMQLPQLLITSVFFVHRDWTSAYPESSFFMPPSQYKLNDSW